MAAEIINLRSARKKKARADKERQAADNRLKHGQRKTSRRLDAANKLLDKKRLDGLVRDRPNAEDGDA